MEKQLNENFQTAAKIAETIETNCRRRAGAGEKEPFYGANADGRKIVLWEQTDHALARAAGISYNGTFETGGRKYYFRDVEKGLTKAFFFSIIRI